MAQIIAKKCWSPHSRWVAGFVWTCDDKLAVQFKDGACCYYPSSGVMHCQLALTWPSPGKFVWRFLYKILPYKLIKNPCAIQIGCGVTVPCAVHPIPQTLHVTITSGCSDINGQSRALTYQGQDPLHNNDYHWQVTDVALFGGSLDLYCQLSNNTWHLLNHTGACASVGADASSFQESPLQMVFNGTSFHSDLNCPNCTTGQAVTFTVTQ